MLPFSIDITRIYIIFGFLTFILIAFHLYGRRRYFKKQVKVNRRNEGLPAIALWAESKNGTIIEAIYLTDSIAFSNRPV